MSFEPKALPLHFYVVLSVWLDFLKVFYIKRSKKLFQEKLESNMQRLIKQCFTSVIFKALESLLQGSFVCFFVQLLNLGEYIQYKVIPWTNWLQ